MIPTEVGCLFGIRKFRTKVLDEDPIKFDFINYSM